jgi:hypothetical protein
LKKEFVFNALGNLKEQNTRDGAYLVKKLLIKQIGIGHYGFNKNIGK